MAANTVISRNLPLTIMALVDSTSLRTSGNFSGIIGQGDYATNGGMSFQLEISAAASPALIFSASQASGASTWSGTVDSTGGPVVTANTGWWLVAACVRHAGATLAVQYYAYRYSTNTLTTAAGGTIGFVAGASQLAPPATGSVTAVAAEGEITVSDIYPGGFAWCGVWNADLSESQSANPTPIWAAISEGPLAIADSTLAGLWILDNGDAHDYSTNAHNGTYVASPTFVGTPVNYLPLVMPYRTTAVAGGVAPQALVGQAASATAAGGALTLAAASAQSLVGAAGSATAATAALTETPAAAQNLVGTAASATSAGGAFTSGATALNFVGTAASASAASAALTIAAAAAQPLVGAASSATAAGGALTETPAAAQHLVGTAASATSANGALGAETANFEIGVKTAGTGGNDLAPSAVRDSANRLWRAAFTTGTTDFTNNAGQYNNNTLRMYRCTTTGVPAAFAEQDSAHRPTNIGSFSMAIDGADLIHVAYVATYAAATTGIYYVTFNTSTNLWGTPVKIGTVNFATTATYIMGDTGVAMALDAAGAPHVVHYGQTSGTGATHIFYTNKTSGSWSTALQLDTATLGGGQRCMHPMCMFDSTGALHVAWMTITANYGTTLEHAYYIKRSAAGSFGSVTTFAENLLGGVDNGPSLYVSEDDHVHIVYGLGDGSNPVGQAVTGATVNNSVFYRFSTDGGATWNTTTQPAHFVSHSFSLGPSGDDAGGVRIYVHSQPTTVDGLGTAIGYMQLPKGGSWAAWTQIANDTNGNGYDCTVSPRREQFFHNGVKYLDTAYTDANLPASAMLSSDPTGLVVAPLVATAQSATAASGALTQTPAAPQPLVGGAASQSAAAAGLTETPVAPQALAGSAASMTAAAAALTIAAAAAQPLIGTAASQSAASGALTQGGVAAQALTGTAASASGAGGGLTETPAPPQSLTGTAASATSAGGALTLTNPSGVLGGTSSSATGAQGALTLATPPARALVGGAAASTAATAALALVTPPPLLLTGTATSLSAARAALASGTAVVYGTVTLADTAVTTIVLTDRAVTTITLTVTDEEGVAMNSYLLGNVARLNAVVKDSTGIDIDAGTALISARPPSGAFAPVTPTHVGTGLYAYDYKAAVAGTHTIRAETTNPDAAAELSIYFEPSGVL